MIVGFVVSDWKSDIFPHCSLYTLLVFACVCAGMKSHMRNIVICVVPALENWNNSTGYLFHYCHISADCSVFSFSCSWSIMFISVCVCACVRLCVRACVCVCVCVCVFFCPLIHSAPPSHLSLVLGIFNHLITSQPTVSNTYSHWHFYDYFKQAV